MQKATRNQLGNLTNPCQTPVKRVLTVCSAGLLRSPTLANVLHSTFGFNTRSCGSSQEFALIPVTEALLRWADVIVFVNQENCNEVIRNELAATIIENKQVLVLDLPDEFNWNDEELKQISLNQFNSKF